MRLELVKALASFDDAATPALPGLEIAAKDEDALVREAAVDAIRRIKQEGERK